MTTAEKAVRTAVSDYLAAGDAQDADRIATVTDPVFRVTVNQFRGKPGVTVIDRDTYLGMIRGRKLGGTPRTVDYKSVEVVGNVAFVRASIDSEKLHFESLYTLAQSVDGDWLVTSDIPFTTPR